MTRLMEKAIEWLRGLPENQQDRLAEFLLHELAEDQRWADTTSAHAGKLKALADNILADDARCIRFSLAAPATAPPPAPVRGTFPA